MIHSGSANGGHYYAYIKSFEDYSWYSFNDETVNPISEDQLSGVFGTDKSLYSTAYTSSTNAYMLMYRKITADNQKFLDHNTLPDHINDIIKKEMASSHSNSSILTSSKNPSHFGPRFSDITKITVNIASSRSEPERCALSIEDANIDDYKSYKIQFDKETTCEEILERAIKKFVKTDEEDTLALVDRARLVVISKKNECPDYALGEKYEPLDDDVIMDDVLNVSTGQDIFRKVKHANLYELLGNGQLRDYAADNEIQLLIEIRDKESEDFDRYRHRAGYMKIYLADYSEQKFTYPKLISYQKSSTFESIINEIRDILQKQQSNLIQASGDSKCESFITADRISAYATYKTNPWNSSQQQVSILPPPDDMDITETLEKLFESGEFSKIPRSCKVYCELLPAQAIYEDIECSDRKNSPIFDSGMPTSVECSYVSSSPEKEVQNIDAEVQKKSSPKIDQKTSKERLHDLILTRSNTKMIDVVLYPSQEQIDKFRGPDLYMNFKQMSIPQKLNDSVLKIL